MVIVVVVAMFTALLVPLSFLSHLYRPPPLASPRQKKLKNKNYRKNEQKKKMHFANRPKSKDEKLTRAPVHYAWHTV